MSRMFFYREISADKEIIRLRSEFQMDRHRNGINTIRYVIHIKG